MTRNQARRILTAGRRYERHCQRLNATNGLWGLSRRERGARRRLLLNHPRPWYPPLWP